MTPHDAFISYSHSADHGLAREIERAVERFAKPWYKRRSLDVFRDEGNLNLTPHLWGGIEQALDRSRYVIHLASKAAAKSPWVHKELAHWMAAEHARRNRFLIVVTDGALVWDDGRQDFDPVASTAVSPALYGVFPGEPFYLDLRWAAEHKHQLRDDPRFTSAVVSLVAAIRQQSAEDLAGEDAEQHRRTMRVRNLAIGALSVLSAVAVAGAWLATNQAREATRQRGIAEREATTAREALARLSVDAAARNVTGNRPGGTLAHLARAARADPASPAGGWIAEVVLNEPLWLPGPPLSHAAAVVGAAVTPDGTRVVTASVDGTARIWDLATGAAIGSPMVHDGSIATVTVSPAGGLVATTSSDRTARLWDAATGAAIGTPLVHDWRVHAAAFSPDGRRLVTTTHGRAHVWDTKTTQAVTPPLDHGTGEAIDAAAFSPDGRLIVTGAADYSARGWDAATGAAVGQVRHRSDVYDVQFSPDGQRLLTASADRTAQLWDVATGAPIGSPLRHTGFVESAQFSADGRFIVTASSDGTASVWDAATRARVGKPLEHGAGVNSAQFSRNGRRVVTASSDHTARVWDTATGLPVGRPLEHAENVTSAMFSQDDQAVITVSSDMTARVWAWSAEPLGRLTLAHAAAVEEAEFSRDGSLIVAESARRAYVWDAVRGRQLAVTTPYSDFLTGAHLSPDGRRVVTESRGDVRLWDASTGAPIGEPAKGANAGTFSPDSRYLLVTSETVMSVREASTGTPVNPPSPFGSPIAAAAFLPDGTLAVFRDRTRYVWNLTTGAVTNSALAVSASPAGPGRWLLSPGGRFLLTEEDTDLQVRDAATGKTLGANLQHLFVVPGVAFSPDERMVATSSGTAARTWGLPSGQPIAPMLEHADSVQGLEFSSDGRRLVTVCRDGTARTWDAATGVAAGVTFSYPQFTLSAAAFSPDGRRLLTASLDGVVAVRTIALDLPAAERPDLVADLAELVGGLRVSELGSLEPVPRDDWHRAWTRVTGLQYVRPPTRALLVGRFRIDPPTARAGQAP